MAEHSVADFTAFINRQIKLQEQVENIAWQLEALLEVATTNTNFYEASNIILHSYFSVAADLVVELTKINQLSINDLTQQPT